MIFKASTGWLNRFRQRNNINFASVCGESGSVSEKQVTYWISMLPDIARGYIPCDIYSMDETGLCFRSLPGKSLSIRGEDCKGGKKSKDRIAVSLCVSMVHEECDRVARDWETQPESLDEFPHFLQNG